MYFSYDEEQLGAVIEDAKKLDGIYYIRIWPNEGGLVTGDDIMYVLIGGDIHPGVVDALNYLVGCIILINGKPGTKRTKPNDGDVVQLLSPVAGG